jgi:hypothetical protein
MDIPEASFLVWQQQFSSKEDCVADLFSWLSSDKGSISALRLKKLIEVNWRTARLILKKLRLALGHHLVDE